ncbi:MAG: M23 family metallopeptidase [Parcubacteria group bacterium]|nr:M23 family metallopeptidase [Parcubacteria group bacterium]
MPYDDEQTDEREDAQDEVEPQGEESPKRNRAQEVRERAREAAKEALKEVAKQTARRVIAQGIRSAIVATAPLWGTILLYLLAILITVFLIVIVVAAACNTPGIRELMQLPIVFGPEACAAFEVGGELNLGGESGGGGAGKKFPPPPAPAQCSNRIDDDGDTLVDSADPGCTSATDDDERDTAPPPPPETVKCTDYLRSPSSNTSFLVTDSWATVRAVRECVPHPGLDVGVAPPGQSVVAAHDGRVVYVGHENDPSDGFIAQWSVVLEAGEECELNSGNKIRPYTVYLHLRSVNVANGQENVARGDAVGESGGSITIENGVQDVKEHLHYEIHKRDPALARADGDYFRVIYSWASDFLYTINPQVYTAYQCVNNAFHICEPGYVDDIQGQDDSCVDGDGFEFDRARYAPSGQWPPPNGNE